MGKHDERHADDWLPVTPTDDRLRGLYRRHYSSAKATLRFGPLKRGQNNVVGPGECLCLLTADCRAGFIWRLSRYRKDGQTGVECTLFRNEGSTAARYSSCLIRGATYLARLRWPGLRLFTFVDPRKVASRNPGYCFIKAGWRRAGTTKRGLLVFEEAGNG